MKIIRASEIGTYQFCQRAWWYQQQGYEPDNRSELAGGIDIHEHHSRRVIASNFLRSIAYGSLFLTVLMVIIWLIQASSYNLFH